VVRALVTLPRPGYVRTFRYRTVATSEGVERLPGVLFRRLDTAGEFHAVQEVQKDAWGLDKDPPVPAPLMRAIQDNGGLLLGAFRERQLVGFAMGFLGREGGTTFHYSHMVAVRPSDQAHHLGHELKLYQREEVLAQGLTEIRWTFDPLQSRNAMRSVRRLGGRPVRYLPRYYGPMSDSINAGLETDRLLLVWPIASHRVEERLEKAPSPQDDDPSRWKRSFAVIETAIRPSGVRIPVSTRPPGSSELALEIPIDLARVREAEPGGAQSWRAATRTAFETAFANGYRVDDFVRLSVGGESRCFYLLDTAPDDDAT